MPEVLEVLGARLTLGGDGGQAYVGSLGHGWWCHLIPPKGLHGYRALLGCRSAAFEEWSHQGEATPEEAFHFELESTHDCLRDWVQCALEGARQNEAEGAWYRGQLFRTLGDFASLRGILAGLPRDKGARC